jgi:hypothetical protein
MTLSYKECDQYKIGYNDSLNPRVTRYTEKKQLKKSALYIII